MMLVVCVILCRLRLLKLCLFFIRWCVVFISVWWVCCFCLVWGEDIWFFLVDW